MGSRVRGARGTDLDAVMRMARQMHAEAPAYRERPFVDAKVAKFLAALCLRTLPDMIMLVAEDAGEVVGAMVGMLSPEWFNDEKLVAEIALYVDPEHRRGFTALKLVRALAAWGRERGANHMRAGVGTGAGVEGTVRLYEHLGFRVIGPVLRLELGVGHGA